MRLLYEQAAREQRELAERVRATHGNDMLAANFERWASDLERLARPTNANRGASALFCRHEQRA
jgi:hypothetical protein